jgi:hypothetical protein
MIRIYLSEKFQKASSFEVQLYLRTYAIWSKQRKIAMKMESDDKGAYIEFESEEDATLFKLTVWNYNARSNLVVL